MLFTSSSVSKFTVSHSLSTTAFNVLNILLPNPIEQIWKQIRQMGFGNKIFKTLNAVVNKLCDTINLLTDELVKSITLREWIYSVI